MTPPSPRTLFRAAARAEMVTWALLLLAMGLKYGGVTEALMPVAGGVHGFVFLCYALSTLAVWIDGRWGVGRGLLGLASAVVPFMTVPFERAMARRGEPADRWQVLADRGRRGVPDRALRWVLAHPAAAALLALVVVGAVFTALLAAGPPTEWSQG